MRFDVAGLPANKQKEIRATLERRAKELGYRLDPTAAVTFIASADTTGKKVNETFSIGNRSVTGTYMARYARLKIVKNGDVLWQAVGCNHPGLIEMFPYGVDAKEYIGRFGAPEYTLFENRALPEMIRAGGGATRPLGESTLAASGLR